MTGGALLLLTASLGTSTATMWTRDILANLELLGNTSINLLECKFHLQAQVAAAMLLSATLSAAKATKAVTAENVAEHREDIIHVHVGFESAETTKSAAHVRTVESELVVLLTCLWVVQYIVCLGRLLKFFLGFLVARITVGVVLDGNLSIRFLNFVFCGAFLYAQHLVIISFLCHLIVNYQLSIVNFHCPTATLAWRITLSFSLYPSCRQSITLPFLSSPIPGTIATASCRSVSKSASLVSILLTP